MQPSSVSSTPMTQAASTSQPLPQTSHKGLPKPKATPKTPAGAAPPRVVDPTPIQQVADSMAPSAASVAPSSSSPVAQTGAKPPVEQGSKAAPVEQVSRSQGAEAVPKPPGGEQGSASAPSELVSQLPSSESGDKPMIGQSTSGKSTDKSQAVQPSSDETKAEKQPGSAVQQESTPAVTEQGPVSPEPDKPSEGPPQSQAPTATPLISNPLEETTPKPAPANNGASTAAKVKGETEGSGANVKSPTTPPPAESGGSSSVEAMYESPSPPSTASSPEYSQDYGAISRRRRSAQGVTVSDGDVPVDDSRLRSISPIQSGRGVHRRDKDMVGTRGMTYGDDGGEGNWQASSFVPVLADESTGLLALEGGSMSGSDMALSQTRADLEQARLASSREMSRRERLEGIKDRYILGCSMAVMTAVVFVIVVSGMTTLLANRNFARMEVYSDWPNGGIIPLKYGCHAPDGKPVSIPLRWRNVPRQATNLAVLLAHPGAISSMGYDPVHWFVTGIPVDPEKDGALPANASGNPQLMPEEAHEHNNGHTAEGAYWPPCDHNGTNRYVVHVYAVEAPPVIQDFKEARKIMSRFAGVPVARITGLYGKQRPLVINDDHDNNKDDGHGGKEKGHSRSEHTTHHQVDVKMR